MPFQHLSRSLFALARSKPLLVAFIAFAALGVLGAGLKYLEEDAKKQHTLKPNDRGLLSKVNPFLTAPSPTPTPQLSKEYIYAGSRLLAVEDANANAAPPADLAVWRPSNGTWYVLGGTGSQQTTQGWGLGTDKPAPGDFDGDGKTDFSVFRPGEGNWYIMFSSNGSINVWSWGLNGDKVAQADYDGDGKTDAALFRPSNSKWYILRSSDQAMTEAEFGISGDLPASADYDGDGRADIGVWRASDTNFYSINSSNGLINTINFTPSGTPVSADYDGDGKADYAIRNGASWVILKSSNWQTETISPTWEESSDTPVPNDYDGDGKCDIAVWRNSNGNWYIRQSALANSLRQVAWGLTGDTPVPAYYRR